MCHTKRKNSYDVCFFLDSIVVMDNASYHSRKLDKIPTMAMRKADIVAWLDNHSIAYPTPVNKVNKLTLIGLAKASGVEVLYAVENLAAAKKVRILRLPPYHCQFNPIEMAWAQFKSFVSRRNGRCLLENVRELITESCNNISPQNWENYCQHVNRIGIEAAADDIRRQELAENEFLIDLEETESESELEDDIESHHITLNNVMDEEVLIESETINNM